MKMPSKAICIIAGGTIALLLIAVLIFRHINGNIKQDVETGAFKNKYEFAIESIDQTTQSVRNKMKANIETAPASFQTAMRQPKPAEPIVTSDAPIRLQGILWTENTPLALINGDMLQIGEETHGFKLIQITTDTVILEKDSGEEITLRLMEDIE